jgi:hypothetical protein
MFDNIILFLDREGFQIFLAVITVVFLAAVVKICNVMDKYYKIRDVARRVSNSYAVTRNIINENIKIKMAPSLSNITGVFEIHITVDHEQDGFVKLLEYSKTLPNTKVLYAVSDIRNNQYMLSMYTPRVTLHTVIEKANKLAEDMLSQGMTVIRVKVEAMINSATVGIPENGIGENEYFEYHVKIKKLGKPTSFANLTTDHTVQTAISYNLMSKNILPLYTIRMYNIGLTSANDYKDKILKCLQNIGYEFADHIQSEFTVYDSNIELDNGLLK